MENQLKAIEYQIVHAIPGRIRVKIPALKCDRSYADQLQQLVMAVPEVSTVRVNITSESMIVSYPVRGGNRETVLKDVQSQLVACIQKAGQSFTVSNAISVEEFISAEIPASKVSTPPLAQQDTIQPTATASDSAASCTSTESPPVERIESDIVDIFDALGFSLPEGYVDLSLLAVDVDQAGKVLHIGLPAEILLSVLKPELEKFAHENEKTTETEQIHLDVDVFPMDDGLRLEGKATGQFRKCIFTVPILQRKHYTPWVELSAVGQANLVAHIIDETLYLEMEELQVSGDPGEWQEELIKYAFDHLFKDKVVTKINEVLSNYNGTKLQNLFFESRSGQDFLAKTQQVGLTRDRINTLLSFFEINARLTGERVWFSIQF